MAFEQRFRMFGQQAEAVDQFFVHAVEFFRRFAIGEPLVEHQPFVHVIAVFIGQQRRRVQVDFGGNAIGSAAGQVGSSDTGYGLLATLIILLLAFGSFFAAILPLGVALFAIGIATAVTVLLSHAIDIANFAPILGSLIGHRNGCEAACPEARHSSQ